VQSLYQFPRTHAGFSVATLSTFIALFTLVVSPIASGLFVVRETFITHSKLSANYTAFSFIPSGSDFTYKSVQTLGLNPAVSSLIPFQAAAGFMQCMYAIPSE
jgi:hypothetical protein